MKYILVILLLCFGTYDEKTFCTENSVTTFIKFYFRQQQQEPFYFVTPIPPAKKLLDNIDLSFFKNRLAVSTYRYRIQIPEATETSIDRRLSVWSGWTRSDLAEIKIPRLDLEGGYKLIVEYNPVEGNETKRFEVPFYVYYSSPVRTASNAGYTEKAITGQVTREIKPSPASLAERKTEPAPTRATEEKTDTRSERTEPLKSVSESRTSRKNDPLRDLSSVRLAVNTKPQIVNIQESVTDMSEPKPVYPDIVSEINDSLLIPEGTIDTVFITEFLPDYEIIIPGDPGSEIIGHAAPDSVENTSTDSTEVSALPVNLTARNGDSELHQAILSWRNDYAKELISGMADLNLKNNSGFTPLHVAVMLNNEEIVRQLILNGADVNASGNTGYTPLHIASELNFFDTAAELIFNGARTGIKTDQGMTPAMIAKIQGNNEIAKLLVKKDSAFFLLKKGTSGRNVINARSSLNGNTFDFNLPYDRTLVRKRQLNNILRLVAAPVFVIGTSGFVSYKLKANNNFDLSRIAETEAMAKTLFDKGVKYNRTATIAGGFSVVSGYAIIHATLRKKSITTKMAKVF